jgi:hypothetical protein
VYITQNKFDNISILAVTLSEVQSVDALSQSSAVKLFSPFHVIREPWALDTNVFKNAAVTGYALLDIIITFPVDM